MQSTKHKCKSMITTEKLLPNECTLGMIYFEILHEACVTDCLLHCLEKNSKKKDVGHKHTTALTFLTTNSNIQKYK